MNIGTPLPWSICLVGCVKRSGRPHLRIFLHVCTARPRQLRQRPPCRIDFSSFHPRFLACRSHFFLFLPRFLACRNHFLSFPPRFWPVEIGVCRSWRGLPVVQFISAFRLVIMNQATSQVHTHPTTRPQRMTHSLY